MQPIYLHQHKFFIIAHEIKEYKKMCRYYPCYLDKGFLQIGDGIINGKLLTIINNGLISLDELQFLRQIINNKILKK